MEAITSSHILGQFLSPLSNLRSNGAPVPGEHTCDILREVGCDDAGIEATVAARVLHADNSAGAGWRCETRGLFSVPLPECYACPAASAAGPSHARLYRGQRGHSEGASGRALGAAQWTGIPVPCQPLGCNRSQWRGNALRMGYVVVRASFPAPGASHQLPLRPRARVRSLYRLQDPPAERGGRLRLRVHHLQRQLGSPMVPLHPSPQHPELGQGYRAWSWPDSNDARISPSLPGNTSAAESNVPASR